MLHGSINHVSVTVSELAGAMRFLHAAALLPGLRGGGDPPLCDEPGLHHVAFNVARHVQVDEVANLIPQIGGQILEGPAEYPFGVGGYYAVYFTGPDGMKFEVVHMPAAEARARQLGHR